MRKNVIKGLAFASVALAGVTAVPAAAQGSYSRDVYYQSRDENGDDDRYDREDRRYDEQDGDERDSRYDDYRQREAQQRHLEQRRAQHAQSAQGDGYYDRYGNYQTYRGAYPQPRSYYQGRRCSSGTTGAVLGAVLGGLLGREVGRGGYYNEPSTTGLIIGAGGGALAGRAIERNGNRCR